MTPSARISRAERVVREQREALSYPVVWPTEDAEVVEAFAYRAVRDELLRLQRAVLGEPDPTPRIFGPVGTR